jgi:hypothetical protein
MASKGSRDAVRGGRQRPHFSSCVRRGHALSADDRIVLAKRARVTEFNMLEVEEQDGENHRMVSGFSRWHRAGRS